MKREIRTRTGARPRPRAGFTLVELLVVMGIIGLLIGLLIPAVNAAIVATRVAATKNIIEGLDTAIQAFRTDWGCFPPSSRSRSQASDAVDTGGTQNLVYYLLGPSSGSSGTVGWGGASGAAPFGGKATGVYPPYYRGDSRYLSGGMVSDALQPQKLIFYYRAEPALATSSVPLFATSDCPAPTTSGSGGTGTISDSKDTFKSQAQFELLCKKPRPGGSATDTDWVRKDYILISCGPDRYWGPVTTTVSGTTTTVTAVEQVSQMADANCDDITNFSN